VTFSYSRTTLIHRVS